MWTFHQVTLTVKTNEIIRCVTNIQFIHTEFGSFLKVFCQVHSWFNYLLLILNNNMITVICHYTLLQAWIFDCVAGGSKKVLVKWTGVNNISLRSLKLPWEINPLFSYNPWGIAMNTVIDEEILCPPILKSNFPWLLCLLNKVKFWGTALSLVAVQMFLNENSQGMIQLSLLKSVGVTDAKVPSVTCILWFSCSVLLYFVLTVCLRK